MKILFTIAFALTMTTSSTAMVPSNLTVVETSSETRIGNPIKEFLCEWVCPNHPSCN